jgi:sugar/nucleoside kinase (ribokinase family)
VSSAVLALHPGARLVVTAGARGAFAYDGAAWSHAPSLPVAVVSTAGAGDALLGGVLAGLALGLPFAPAGSPRASLAERPLSSALELGALVAAFKVTSPHTIPPDLSLDALLAFAREHGVVLGEGLRRLLPADEEHRHAS